MVELVDIVVVAFAFAFAEAVAREQAVAASEELYSVAANGIY